MREVANLGCRKQWDLLLVPGVGAGQRFGFSIGGRGRPWAPCRFSDPARFSFAHGGKDRHPFPVPLRVYDETIRTLKAAVQNAKLGREAQLGAIKRLDEQARQLEVWTRTPTFEAVIAEEHRTSPTLGGRTVYGWERVASGKAS